MTPVAAIRASIVTPPVGRAPRGDATVSSAPETASGRALIALQPIASGSDADSHHRPQAGFLAHLIATDRKLPQTRERRRAEPADAIAAYAATDAVPPSRVGRRLYRVT